MERELGKHIHHILVLFRAFRHHLWLPVSLCIEFPYSSAKNLIVRTRSSTENKNRATNTNAFTAEQIENYKEKREFEKKNNNNINNNEIEPFLLLENKIQNLTAVKTKPEAATERSMVRKRITMHTHARSRTRRTEKCFCKISTCVHVSY